MKRLLARMLLAIATIATIVPFATPAAANDGQRHLRVASYNIHAGSGNDEQFDPERTAAAIAELDADVVALQEVDVFWDERSQWRDLAGELADKLDMWVFFGPIYSLEPPAPGQPRREYGNALLSRHPIQHARNHEITRLSSQVPDPVPAPMPGFPEIEINVKGQPVHLYGTHLDVQPEPDVREMQVSDMRRIMKRDRGEARILLGDFNAEPQAPELRPLWRGLTDTWAKAGGGVPGYTYPADAPEKRIDYIGVSHGIKVTGVDIPETLASDHRPLVADLKLRHQ